MVYDLYDVYDRHLSEVCNYLNVVVGVAEGKPRVTTHFFSVAYMSRSCSPCLLAHRDWPRPLISSLAGGFLPHVPCAATLYQRMWCVLSMSLFCAALPLSLSCIPSEIPF